jgi:hypothetical protein
MTVEKSEWTIDSALRDATDVAELTRNKLAGGFLNAIDTIVQLANTATNEQVKVTASRTLIRLALELGAVDLGPQSKFEQDWARELRSIRDGSDDV